MRDTAVGNAVEAGENCEISKNHNELCRRWYARRIRPEVNNRNHV